MASPSQSAPLRAREHGGNPDRVRAPWVLDLELGTLSTSAARALSGRAWSSPHPGVERVGRLGGAGLAAALIHDVRACAERPALAIAVGPAVVRGLPTAARATVAGAPAPLRGCYADGQVGGELALGLAALADGLLLRGRVSARGSVLVLRGDRPRPLGELVRAEELRGASPRAAHAWLDARFGPCSTLTIGPAGVRAAPAATLTVDGRHVVGRGGLGALFGATGLAALVVRTAPTSPSPADVGASQRAQVLDWLRASPRLAARAAGGSLELYDERAARGESGAGSLARSARKTAVARAGCRGCPTPCGWTFETGAGARPAHFAANRVLGANLGIEDLAGSLELLAACDAAGLDAKEVGPALALWCVACEQGSTGHASPRGNLRELCTLIHSAGTGRAPSAVVGEGLRAVARRFFPSSSRAQRAVPAGASPAEPIDRLIGRIGGRGGDAMRVFPFLVGTGAGPAALARRVAPMALPAGADDPEDTAGKGRLVWWHESFVAALDANGFCAFSAAGLIADGVAGLDELAAALTDAAGAGEGLRFLADGAALAHLHRVIDARLAPRAHGREPPDDAALEAELAQYAHLRGVDPRDLRPTAAARGRFARGLDPVDTAELLGLGGPALEAHHAGVSAARRSKVAVDANGTSAPGRVRLRAAGALERALGKPCELELDLPAPLLDVLTCAARETGAGPWLLRNDELLPSAYRRGRRVAPDELVYDRDELDLVLALRGG